LDWGNKRRLAEMSASLRFVRGDSLQNDGDRSKFFLAGKQMNRHSPKFLVFEKYVKLEFS